MTVERLEFVFDIHPRLAEGGGWYSNNPDSLNMDSPDNPWLFASGCTRIQYCEIPLLGLKDGPAQYTVKLFFSDMSESQVNALDIKFQGNSYAGSLQKSNLRTAATTPRHCQEYSNVPVESSLKIDCKSPTNAPLATMSAIEVLRNDP